MNNPVKRLAFFISLACLSSPYAVLADNLTTENTNQAISKARPDRDRTPPVITLNGDATLTIPQGSIFQDPGATATDNIDGSVRVRTYGLVNTNRAGSYQITYTATDSRGNLATIKRTVNVIGDTIAPVVTLKGDSTINLLQGQAFTDPGATVTDNIDTNLPIRVIGYVNTNFPGTYTLTYRAKDKAGNIGKVQRQIIVTADTTPPTVSLKGDNPLTLTQGTSFTDPGIEATDNSGLKVHITTLGRVNTSRLGTYTITYIVRDKAGNTTTVKRTVNVIKATPTDTLAPVISLNGSNPVELTVGSTYTDAGATATDNVDGTVTVTTSGTVDTQTVGTYTLTYTATDSAGNTATATRTVIIKALANVVPNANAGNPQTVNEQSTVTLDGSASSDSDGSIATYSWTQTGGDNINLTNADKAQASFTAPDVTQDTTFTFKLTVTDNQGASSESTTTVLVKAVDSTAPVISLNGANPVEITVGATYTDAGATATDNIDGSVNVTTSGSVDTQTVGSYTLTYTATDAAGNAATATRTVVVKQAANIPPISYPVVYQEIIRANDEVLLDGQSSSDEDGFINTYTWTQLSGPTVALVIEPETSMVARFIAPELSANTLLTFKLTVVDDRGATAENTVSLTVRALDTNPPIISINGANPLELKVGETYKELDFDVWDKEEGPDAAIKRTTSGTVDTQTAGTYTITYTATDPSGNKATATRTVIVKAANIAPIANAGSSQTVNEQTTVTLDGSASSDADGSIATYAWTQVSGTAIVLANADKAQASFTAPDVSTDTALTFKLTVTDNQGISSESTTTVTVKATTTPTPIITGQLNDTGVTQCYNGTESALCPVALYPNQDAESGRDFTNNDPSDGHAGFSFTKLDANGQPLADQSVAYSTTPWSCVKDNVTGLIWEVKTQDGGLRDVNWTYSWYEPNLPNGGDPGMENSSSSSCDTAENCNTSNYATRVNAQGLCGASDWRLPTTEELLSLSSFDRQPAIDTAYFPNNASYYWAAEHQVTGDYQIYYARALDLNNGSISAWLYKSTPQAVLLVRGQSGR